MALIYETDNFIVESFETPHVSREEGGHIRILPKKAILDRTKMSPKLAIEFIRLSMIVGKAMKDGMTKRGIKIMRINYQDMGNWAFKTNKKPVFHLHIYGRAKKAKKQIFSEAVYLPPRESGFYDNFIPLNEEDIEEIRKQIETIKNSKKYKTEKWT